MDNIVAIIEEMGFPCSYSHFAEGKVPEPPYICYCSPNSDNFSADGMVLTKINRINLELYTIKKDITMEQKVEETLDFHGIFYNRTETWIDSEKLYEVLYQFHMI